jgi:hypothetical protein
MAGLSNDFFSNAGGAVSDLFSGIGAIENANLKAAGLNLDAQGLQIKAAGDLAEAQTYDLASALATKEASYTADSTAIQALQADRALFSSEGATAQEVGSAGFGAGGSSLDILRDSASQGALAKGVLSEQGYITEQGYQEQAQSYNILSAAGKAAAAGEQQIAAETNQLADQTKTAGEIQAGGDFIGAALKGAAAIAPFLLLA